jgi:hypothetical protein
MIERVFDGEKINRIVNDPSVYPWVRGVCEGPLDLGPLLQDQRHVCLMEDFGGCLFTQQSPGIYEVHTQFLPQGRGAKALATVQGALHWMFTRSGAVEIWTRCPKGNLGARVLAKAIGGREEMVVKQGWVQDGQIIPATIFSLTIQEWMKTAPGLEEIGDWFHRKLEEEYRIAGYSEPVHDDDPSHNRYVGAAVEMIRGGQAYKGQIFYNRFAAMSGYQPIKIINTDPVMVDIRDAILEVHGRNFFVSSLGPHTVH